MKMDPQINRNHKNEGNPKKEEDQNFEGSLKNEDNLAMVPHMTMLCNFYDF